MNPIEISNLYQTIADDFAGVVQYNKDNRIGKPKGWNVTIDTVCDVMTNQSVGPPIERLARVNQLLLDAYESKCLDYRYDKMIESLQNTSWNAEAAEGGRQWMYQTCTEFGFFQTSTGQSQIFGDFFPVDFYVDQCQDVFGGQFTGAFMQEEVEWTNKDYGGLDIEVTNVVFVHGSIDPWHALGITKSVNQGAPAIFIKGLSGRALSVFLLRFVSILTDGVG